MDLNRAALTAIRERTGYNVPQLAARAGIDRSLLHKIEAGQRNATIPVIRKLADALDCPITALTHKEAA